MKQLLARMVVAGALVLIPVGVGVAQVKTESVRKMQQALKDKGYYKGEVDGILGPQTRAALRQYQRSEKLTASGRYTQETATHLGTADKEVGEHFEDAGSDLAQGAKGMGREVKKGEITEGAKDLGKGIGKAAKKVGAGVKDAFDGDEDRKRRGDNPKR